MSQETEIFLWFKIVKTSYRLAASAAENISFSTLSHTDKQSHSCTVIVYGRSNYKYETAVINIIEMRDDKHFSSKKWKKNNIFHQNHETEQKPNESKFKQVPSTSSYRKKLMLTGVTDVTDAAIRFENDKATHNLLLIAYCLMLTA